MKRGFKMINIKKVNKQVEDAILGYFTCKNQYKIEKIDSQYTLIVTVNYTFDFGSVDIIDYINNKTCNVFNIDDNNKKDYNIKKLTVDNILRGYKRYINTHIDDNIYQNIEESIIVNGNTFQNILDILGYWKLKAKLQ
jgi:hypothetical protein